MPLIVVSVPAALALGSPASAEMMTGLPDPVVEIVIGDAFGKDLERIPVQLTKDTQAGTSELAQFVLETVEYRITLSAFLDPDPVIMYAGAIVDFGAPSTFSFVFSQHIVPTLAPGLVMHMHSSSTSDNGPPSGTSVTAVAPQLGIPVDADGTPEIAVYTLSTNGGVTNLNAGLDPGPSFVGASPLATQGPFNGGPIAGPAGSGSYDYMRIDINLAMTGNNDTYTFNGSATVNVIPEPASLRLGLLGIGTIASRRRAR